MHEINLNIFPVRLVFMNKKNKLLDDYVHIIAICRIS